jgi:L-rhamnose mutarotase
MKLFKLPVLLLILTVLPVQLSSQNISKMQKRYCMALDLRNDPALIRQYKHVHTKEGIWPEIPRGIKEVGISDMEIYLLGTRMFMILEAPLLWDYDKEMARLGKLEKQPEWSDYVWQFQQLLPEDKEGVKWIQLEKINQMHPAGQNETPKSGYTEPIYKQPTKRLCAMLDVSDNPHQVDTYRHYKAPAGVIDMQIYMVGTRLYMVMETQTDFKWNKKMKWELMDNVFDLNRDF